MRTHTCRWKCPECGIKQSSFWWETVVQCCRCLAEFYLDRD